MQPKKLSLITGLSYLIIFVAAIFANFFALEAITQNPLQTIEQNGMLVRLGVLAFLIAVVFDIVVAWSLYELYKKHTLTILSTFFRLMHAAIFGVAIFALTLTFTATDAQDILTHVQIFNNIWLIGLFFFGIHLILLAKIIPVPKFISIFLILAGIMYICDTTAHFVFPSYENYATIFLSLVAIPSIVGEMSLTIWFLINGLKKNK